MSYDPELGSILDTVSKDTEDTAHSCILIVSVCEVSKDTEDTAFHVFVHVS